MKAPEPVVIDGVLWKPYSVNHLDADGKKFSFYIFAISREHAACVADDIRETAWLGDEIVGWVCSVTLTQQSKKPSGVATTASNNGTSALCSAVT